MFDKEAVEQYRKTVAPEELKTRVMESYENGSTKKRGIVLYKAISVMAACFVLVIAVSAFLRVANISVMIDGKKVSENGTVIGCNDVSVASMRDVEDGESVIQLELKAFTETTVSVSGGEISTFDAETGMLLESGTESSLKGNVIIRWSVAGKDTCEMKISNAFNDETLKLQYDESSKSWSISK